MARIYLKYFSDNYNFSSSYYLPGGNDWHLPRYKQLYISIRWKNIKIVLFYPMLYINNPAPTCIKGTWKHLQDFPDNSSENWLKTETVYPWKFIDLLISIFRMILLGHMIILGHIWFSFFIRRNKHELKRTLQQDMLCWVFNVH